MRNPTTVLINLTSKASNKNYKYQKLYRNLYNKAFYLEAYQNIYATEGNMTAGTDGQTIDGMSIERIEKVIDLLKSEEYQPNPARRTYIPKKNGGKRPLGIPSFEDKLVQEIVRRILEAIYEPSFSTKSHGFRPNRSCHTALNQVEGTFTAVRWFVEGDIKGFFDNIDHHILINILKKRIDDDKLIRLLWKFLRAGYIENWKYHNTFSGTPQGGIISPILSNIYLNELDVYMEEYKKNFDKGINRKRCKEYRTIIQRADRLKAKYKDIWSDLDEIQKEKIRADINAIKKEAMSYHAFNPMDDGYKRIQYVRYADDFIIGIIGSKEDADTVKEHLTKFLRDKLKLELSQDKTLITHSSDKARFLSYDITISRSNETKTDNKGIKRRTRNLRVKLLMPTEKWVDKLKSIKAVQINNRNEWKSIHRAYLKDNDDLEILSVYNAEIRGLYEYYKMAVNVSNLHKFLYVMKFSMMKTFANKYKSKVSIMMNKYRIGKGFGVKSETKKGEKVRYFYHEGFKRVKKPNTNAKVDYNENILMYSSTTSLIDRIMAEQCEWCANTTVSIEMHHVKKLKELKGKKRWEQLMIARKRKTLALCKTCHNDLHSGRLD
ncbi:reverse transcriptase/maturase family protein [Bacillus alkalicellulosilyticus]|uniref:reverse transcriptase/maturase family protein n=1 Tax=Alkalihalobacterium alkalicellulosilyticum TaxID=1912214 RepID=UPI00099862F1|nr:reverse transcriptase/maturase family protein [Bacillus alkalicellulosilyticus]